MRLAFGVILAAASLVVVPRSSSAQTSLDGFGGLSLSQISSFNDSTVPFDFGGRVGFEVAPGFQLVGEFGRLGNVLPEIVSLPLSFAPVSLRVSAFYGEGGVRLLAPTRSVIRPYVEGTAGVAHLQFGIGGLGATGDAIARAALNLVDTSDPVLGGGGGILIQSGPLNVDLGYRYKRILTEEGFGSLVSLGQNLQSHQVRFGIGVRF